MMNMSQRLKGANLLWDIFGLIVLALLTTASFRTVIDVLTLYRVTWCSAWIPVLITTLLDLLLIAMHRTVRKKPPRGAFYGALCANVLVAQTVALFMSMFP